MYFYNVSVIDITKYYYSRPSWKRLAIITWLIAGKSLEPITLQRNWKQ